MDIHSEEEFQESIQHQALTNLPRLILGGGSNMLLLRDFEGVVLNVEAKGMRVLSETATEVLLEVGAGETWHEVVLHCVKNGWGGIENLSLIPGKMGAAPIQNIGAYGVELTNVFEYLEALDMQSGQKRTFTHAECEFGYRDSVFKRELKGQYLIFKVVLRLQKQPVLNTSYGAIRTELEKLTKPESDWTIQEVSDVVIHIRQSKLPDPKVIGNGGSFFKNPIIPISQYEALKQTHPDLPSYPVNDTHVKVPAGWLIDRAGWKGTRRGDYGVHANQALVLVNYGNAKGQEIYDLSQEILDNIQATYGIELEREVNIIG